MNSLPCLICKRPLEPCSGEEQRHIQPNDGIVCESAGNYGSSLYDAYAIYMETGKRKSLIFNICDSCIIKAADDGLVAEAYQDGDEYHLHMYEVEMHERLWVQSETHEEYEQKLKEFGLQQVDAIMGERDGKTI